VKEMGWDIDTPPGGWDGESHRDGVSLKPLKSYGVYEMEFTNNRGEENLPKIAVVGVGGAGCNIVTAFHNSLCNMKTIAINTDKDSLHERTSADCKIYICKEVLKGEGAHGDVALGKTCAKIHIDEIKQAVAGSDFVFVVGGLGGGTGTGAMPVVIEAAQSQKIMTFAVAIEPFEFEGRTEVAKEGYQHIKGVCSGTVLLSNQKVAEMMPDLMPRQAFAAANRTIMRYIYESAGMLESIYMDEMKRPLDASDKMDREFTMEQLSSAES